MQNSERITANSLYNSDITYNIVHMHSISIIETTFSVGTFKNFDGAATKESEFSRIFLW